MPTIATETATLRAFQKALRKETHTISEQPDLLWQQLYNQLKWEGQPVQKALEAELIRRLGPGASPWLLSLLQPHQSSGYAREFYHHIQTPYQMWAGSLYCCAFSPDGTLLALMGSGLIQIVDVESGQLVAHLTMSGDYCAFSAKGEYFVAVGLYVEETETKDRPAYGAVQLWDTTSWRPRERFTTPFIEGELIRAGAYSPDAQLALVAFDNSFTIWNASTGDRLGTFSTQVGQIWACAFDQNGRFLIIGGELALARWDIATMTWRYRLPTKGDWNRVCACSISPDGRWALAAYLDSSIQLLDAATGQVLWTRADTHRSSSIQQEVQHSAFSPDGRLIATTGPDHLVKLWDRATGEPAGVFAGHEMMVKTCAFSPDGAALVSGGDDSKAILWDVAKRQNSNPFSRWHQQTVTDVAFSPNGAYFVTTSRDETAIIWYLQDDDSLSGTILPHRTKKMVRACAIHPDAEMLITGADDASLRIWKEDGTFVTRLRHSFGVSSYSMGLAGGAPILECAISPDGAWVIAVLFDKVEQWDLLRLRWMRDFTGQRSIHACAVSPNGAWIVTGDDAGHLTIWDSQTGAILHDLAPDARDITHCAVSPDGTAIAAANSDFELLSKYNLHHGITTERHLILWGFDAPTHTWQLRHRLSWETRYITACVFTPDGRAVVAADDSGVIKVWDAGTGMEVCSYMTNQLMFCLALHPYLPIMLGGGEGGALAYAMLVGLDYGPIIVTPFWRGSLVWVQCPCCSHLQQITRARLGKTMLCPRCHLGLRVNAFVLKRRSPAWLTQSDSIPLYNPELGDDDLPQQRWWQFWRKNDV